MTVRQIKPATQRDAAALAIALVLMRKARTELEAADCPKALAAIRNALKSAEGAQRHMLHRLRRTEKP
jgi:hypothetical protein